MIEIGRRGIKMAEDGKMAPSATSASAWSTACRA
jgi:hypothetical protein